MRKWKQTIRRTATEWLSLPPDALLDVSRVTCIDGAEVIVENIDALLKVSESMVEVDLGKQTLLLQGDHFIVTLVAEREVHIRGKVAQLSYVAKKGIQR